MAQLLPGQASSIKKKRPSLRRLPVLFLGLPLIVGAGPVPGAEPSPELRVAKVLSGHSFAVESGQEIRLSFISAPTTPPGMGEPPNWAPAEAARRALMQLVGNRRIQIHPDANDTDRYGRQPSLVYLTDGTLLQTVLLREGHARIVAVPNEESLSRELLDAEKEARLTRRGLWGHPYYRIRPARPALLESGRFQLVIGELTSANRVRSGGYLNFGRYWRTDVTVKLDREAAEGIEQRHGPLDQLAGRRVLVRGWVEQDDGPLIEIRDHRLVELLD